MGPAVIPLALAAVSTGAQYYNQSQAQGRQNAADTQAILNQEQIQQQAAGKVNQQVQQIARDNPQQLAANATAQYVQQLRRNAAGSMEGGSTSTPTTYGAPTSAVGATAGADPRFAKMLGADQQQVQAYGNTNANELGQMDAAVRQRQLEGLQMQGLQTGLDTLNAQSYAQNFVDSLRAQAAGQQNPWLALGASVLGNAANATSKNLGPSTTAATNPAVQAYANAWNASQGYPTG